MSYRDLLDQDDAPGWRPEAGDSLIGKITDISSRDGGYGVYPILVVDEEETGRRLAVHCFDTVLRGEVAARAPRIGDVVGFKCLGRQQPKTPGGQPYNGWKFRIFEQAAQKPTPPDDEEPF